MTGLTSNPTIFDQRDQEQHDLRRGHLRRSAVRRNRARTLFFELALEDLTRAADLFRPIFAADRRRGRLGVAGGVARCWPTTPRARSRRRATCTSAAARPNLFIKIPGTTEGLPAIEEAIFAGVPINVTLLFSREQYVAAAEAYLRGIERRIAAGLNPAVASVASLFVSRWDVAVSRQGPGELTQSTRHRRSRSAPTRPICELLASPRFQRAANAGARPQRLLWASTGTKDPKASDILYVKALAAPFTVNTMPEGTLKAFADHGEVGEALPADGGDCEAVLASFAKAGIDIDALAAQLQDEGATSFVKSWNDLMAVHRIQERAQCARRVKRMTAASRQHKRCVKRSAEATIDGMPPLRGRPAWTAAREALSEDASDVHLRQLFADDPERGERLTVEAAGIYLDYSKNRITDETLRAAAAARDEVRAAGSHRRHVPRRQDQRHREPRGAARRAARAARRVHHAWTAQNVVPEVHAVLDKMADFCRPGAQRRMEGPHRQAHPQRHQHRHRRLRSRAGHGLRGAASTTASATMTFRFVSNVDGTDFAEAVRDLDPDGDALHRLLEDLHHARDDDQRAHRARLAAGRPARRREAPSPSILSPSRPMPRRSRSSASIPPTCSASGTGSAAAIPWIRPSASRPCSPSARTISAPCSAASTRWTSISAPRRSSAICRC